MLKKVIVLNDLSSNILSQAILILKEDMEIGDDININGNDIKIKSAIEEANNIIEECMYKIEQENTKKKNFFHKIIDKVTRKENKF